MTHSSLRDFDGIGKDFVAVDAAAAIKSNVM
jgi:hypothetical protein